MKKLVFIFICLLTGWPVLAQENKSPGLGDTKAPSEISESSASTQKIDPSTKTEKSEMEKIFEVYSKEKEKLEKDYAEKINVLDSAGESGKPEKQKLIKELNAMKKILLTAFRENTKRIQMTQRAALRKGHSIKEEAGREPEIIIRKSVPKSTRPGDYSAPSEQKTGNKKYPQSTTKNKTETKPRSTYVFKKPKTEKKSISKKNSFKTNTNSILESE
ncbi:MAG: hypothetical protein KBD53_02950 [Candidatus Omnitrophica bacterium]|nr:hypothetical protein [Candidatus Omnitrophota bacterium]